MTAQEMENTQRKLIYFKKLDTNATIPVKKHENDASYDLASLHDAIVDGLSQTVIETGIAIYIPEGFCGVIHPRSSLALAGITMDGGLIDAAYTGEIRIIMVNRTINHFHINKGDRIAQLVITPISTATLMETYKTPETERGKQGFGSTGIMYYMPSIQEIEHYQRLPVESNGQT